MTVSVSTLTIEKLILVNHFRLSFKPFIILPAQLFIRIMHGLSIFPIRLSFQEGHLCVCVYQAHINSLQDSSYHLVKPTSSADIYSCAPSVLHLSLSVAQDSHARVSELKTLQITYGTPIILETVQCRIAFFVLSMQPHLKVDLCIPSLQKNIFFMYLVFSIYYKIIS